MRNPEQSDSIPDPIPEIKLIQPESLLTFVDVFSQTQLRIDPILQEVRASEMFACGKILPHQIPAILLEIHLGLFLDSIPQSYVQGFDAHPISDQYRTTHFKFRNRIPPLTGMKALLIDQKDVNPFSEYSAITTFEDKPVVFYSKVKPFRKERNTSNVKRQLIAPLRNSWLQPVSERFETQDIGLVLVTLNEPTILSMDSIRKFTNEENGLIASIPYSEAEYSQVVVEAQEQLGLI